MRPKSVTLNKKEQYLEIVWETDEACEYPFSHLREACPCVKCRGGHQFMGMNFAPNSVMDLKPTRSYTMKELFPVGNYALQPRWDDGHDTGIYTWEYLYHIRPNKTEE